MRTRASSARSWTAATAVTLVLIATLVLACQTGTDPEPTTGDGGFAGETSSAGSGGAAGAAGGAGRSGAAGTGGR